METSSVQYKDPFMLSVFGVIFIFIGLGMLQKAKRFCVLALASSE